jgi:hypothetical protein
LSTRSTSAKSKKMAGTDRTWRLLLDCLEFHSANQQLVPSCGWHTQEGRLPLGREADG